MQVEAADGGLQQLYSEVAGEEQSLRELECQQNAANAQQTAWMEATESALQTEVEAAHVANIEVLVELDSRLDEEAALRDELQRLATARVSWEEVGASEARDREALSGKAAQCTYEGNQLQEVYASRAKEVEGLYSAHAATL